MLDHVSIRVTDYNRSRNFYEAALAPLGYTLAMESDAGAGFRTGPVPSFWIKEGRPPSSGRQHQSEDVRGCGAEPVHIAFASENRSTVDAFHRAALAAGGEDYGAPRLCPEYHPNYYGAFVLDPDGYNVEAVCHKAE